MSGSSRIQNIVRKTVGEGRNVLATSKSELELQAALRRIGLFLPMQSKEGLVNDKSTSLPDCPELSGDELAAARHDFCKHHYVGFVEFLCRELTLEWYSRFGRSPVGNELFNRFFLDGIPQDALLVLYAAVQNSRYVFSKKLWFNVCKFVMILQSALPWLR